MHGVWNPRSALIACVLRKMTGFIFSPIKRGLKKTILKILSRAEVSKLSEGTNNKKTLSLVAIECLPKILKTAMEQETGHRQSVNRGVELVKMKLYFKNKGHSLPAAGLQQ